ncbi:hypothetical protein [Planobispora longispora]|uniref:Uncharacterized protein n=1 Tax=Planobispora longispora TaxID=28887 RepID=A0A8J3RL33_9ACTN|nr:hypothetical protein [Planobispora longispora]GIH78506.1 hypothetical protein Plo01_49350 [Planobispora longispora]
MIERADQLVLEYVSKVADAAHGVLRQDQRLDFVRRLRERIDAERRGAESLAAVQKVLAVFGDPAALVAREVRRLEETQAPPVDDSPTLMASAEAVTRELPAVAPKPPPTARPGPGEIPVPGGRRPSQGMPPGVARFTEEARKTLAGRETGGRLARRRARGGPAVPEGDDLLGLGESGPEEPGARRGRRGRRRGMGGRGRRSMPGAGRGGGDFDDGERGGTGSGGRGSGWRSDAGSILASRPREVVGVVVLAVAGLLVPASLAPIAIFSIPFIVWAVGTVVVLSCPGWEVGDKVLGVAAPVLVYAIGGAAVAIARAKGDLGRMLSGFQDVSGSMFIIGTVLGVLWLAYRLFNPPAPFTGRPR